MEGDEMVELLRRAVAVVEERQDKLERLQEAIRLSSGSRRGEVIDRRIKLSADIIAWIPPCGLSSHASTTRSRRSTRCSVRCEALDAIHARGGCGRTVSSFGPAGGFRASP